MSYTETTATTPTPRPALAPPSPASSYDAPPPPTSTPIKPTHNKQHLAPANKLTSNSAAAVTTVPHGLRTPPPISPFAPITPSRNTGPLVVASHRPIIPARPPRALPAVTDSTPLYVRFLISTHYCSVILGEGGSTIDSIRTSSGASLEISDARTPRRIVKVNGKKHQVERAAHAILHRIQASVKQRHGEEVTSGTESSSSSHSNTPPPPNVSVASTDNSTASSPQLPPSVVSSSASTPPTTPSMPALPPPATTDSAPVPPPTLPPSPYAFAFTVLVPNSQIGAILGVGGSTLEKTRTKSAAAIIVTGELADSTERAVEIRGEVAHITIAVDTILEQICQIQSLGAPPAKVPYAPEMGECSKPQPSPVPKSILPPITIETPEPKARRSRREKKRDRREELQRRAASSPIFASNPSPSAETQEGDEEGETQISEERSQNPIPSPPLSPKAAPFNPSSAYTYNPLVVQIHHVNAQLQHLIATSVYANLGSASLHIIQSQIQQLQQHLHVLHSQLYMEQMGYVPFQPLPPPSVPHHPAHFRHPPGTIMYQSPEATVSTLRAFTATVPGRYPYPSANPPPSEPIDVESTSGPTTASPLLLRLPSFLLGVVIGKNGGMISQLREQSGAVIRIEDTQAMRDRRKIELAQRRRANDPARKKGRKQKANDTDVDENKTIETDSDPNAAADEVGDPYELRGLSISGSASAIEHAAQLIARLIEKKAPQLHLPPPQNPDYVDSPSTESTAPVAPLKPQPSSTKTFLELDSAAQNLSASEKTPKPAQTRGKAPGAVSTEA